MIKAMIITLTGLNDFVRTRELQKLVADFVQKHGDFALEKMDGGEATFERLQEGLQSLPFLADRKMVVLYTPGANKQFADAAETLLKEAPETTDVVIVEPKLDKRLSYYKILKKATDFREFSELDAGGLAKWAVEYAKEQGGTLTSADAHMLVERVGVGQQRLQNELDKLIAYNPAITRQTIGVLTEQTPQSTIFALLDAAFNGQTARAQELYAEQRALKVEPQAIIAMLAWQLHILAVVKSAGSRPPDDIARLAKLNPFVVRKSQALTRRLTLEDLKTRIEALLTLDKRLKTTAINADEATQLFLLTL